MINWHDHIPQAGVCSNINWHIWIVSNWIAMLYTSLSTEGYTVFGSYMEILDTITKALCKNWLLCLLQYDNISKRCTMLTVHYAAFAYLSASYLSHLCCIHIMWRVVKSYMYITYVIVVPPLNKISKAVIPAWCNMAETRTYTAGDVIANSMPREIRALVNCALWGIISVGGRFKRYIALICRELILCPYSAELLLWHWYTGCLNANEAIRRNMDKIDYYLTITKHEEMWITCLILICPIQDVFWHLPLGVSIAQSGISPQLQPGMKLGVT